MIGFKHRPPAMDGKFLYKHFGWAPTKEDSERYYQLAMWSNDYVGNLAPRQKVYKTVWRFIGGL